MVKQALELRAAQLRLGFHRWTFAVGGWLNEPPELGGSGGAWDNLESGVWSFPWGTGQCGWGSVMLELDSGKPSVWVEVGTASLPNA